MSEGTQTQQEATYQLASWLFLRLLGGVYLIAFLSLWDQIQGLVGSGGILPVGVLLETVREELGAQGYWFFPTLCWLNPGDAFLHVLCGAGVLLALLVVVGWVEVPALFSLWVCYLSLATVGRNFLSFQWDGLLLEVGLLAVFLPSLQLRSRLGRGTPSPLTLWLLRWLLFRLMFASGMVKLASNDETWRGLTALRFHYETQPLPTWLGWYAHQLPNWFQSVSVLALFAIELGVPFLILGPPRVRRLAFGPLIALQGLIALTGNYAFFNLLAATLCLLLLDDDAWPIRHGKRWLQGIQGAGAGRGWPRWILVPVAGLSLFFSSIQLMSSFPLSLPWPRPVVKLHSWASPWRSVNSYGLFAVMTTERQEIVIQGSFDGQIWRSYEFKWKPGDPGYRPRFVAPHQPRLDWQLWFAALGTYRDNPWFLLFLARLAEGSPEVLELVKENPFAHAPPRYLRARLYNYRFSDFAHRRDTDDWWQRQEQGPYLPTVPVETLLRLLPSQKPAE